MEKRYHVILERYNGRRGFIFNHEVKVGQGLYHLGRFWKVYKVEEYTA